MKTGCGAYAATHVETADQGKLILIAYDVAIKHCKISLEQFNDREHIKERTQHICRAQDAVTELMGALRMDVGDIAHNLYRLYDYILRRMVEANIKNDKAKIEEVLGYLSELRDAWSQAIVNIKREATRTSEPILQNFAITG
jgi:flagellar secretion chaperone FliS